LRSYSYISQQNLNTICKSISEIHIHTQTWAKQRPRRRRKSHKNHARSTCAVLSQLFTLFELLCSARLGSGLVAAWANSQRVCASALPLSTPASTTASTSPLTIARRAHWAQRAVQAVGSGQGSFSLSVSVSGSALSRLAIRRKNAV